MAESERKGSGPRIANRKAMKKSDPAAGLRNEGSRQEFTVVRGKRLEKVEFHAMAGHNVLSIVFEDKTSLEFTIDTAFSLAPIYSDWKSGNERRIKSWPRLHSITET
jgi:hypothetical protein